MTSINITFFWDFTWEVSYYSCPNRAEQAWWNVVQPDCGQGQRAKRGQRLQGWPCNLSIRAAVKKSGVSVTSASARRQYLSVLAGGVLQFAPSWPGHGPWSCAVKEVHLGSWSHPFWSEKSLPCWDDTYIGNYTICWAQTWSKKVVIRIPVYLVVQPANSAPKTEFLHHLRKEENMTN